MAMRRISLSLALCAALCLAQTPPEISTQNESVIFQSKVTLVLVPVVVRDAQGRPIGNLTKDDFQLFDRGKRQTIASFSAIKRESGAAEGPAPLTGGARNDENGVGTQAAESGPAAPAVAKQSPERFLIYLFDDRNTKFANLVAAREAAMRHFKRGLRSTDRAAIYTFSGATPWSSPTIRTSSRRR
jgi:VWFA-related protein